MYNGIEILCLIIKIFLLKTWPEIAQDRKVWKEKRRPLPSNGTLIRPAWGLPNKDDRSNHLTSLLACR